MKFNEISIKIVLHWKFNNLSLLLIGNYISIEEKNSNENVGSTCVCVCSLSILPPTHTPTTRPIRSNNKNWYLFWMCGEIVISVFVTGEFKM